MSISIPRRHYAPLKSINELDADSLNKLAGILSNASPTLSQNELASHIKSKGFTTTDDKTIADIIELLLSLYFLRHTSYREEIDDEFFSDIVNAVKTDFSKDTWEQLRVNLTTLMPVDGSLCVIAKAFSLIVEYERPFRNSKIDTDVRYIFTEKGKIKPQAYLITHTLKLDFQKKDQVESLYIAMDSNDIRSLQAVLDRALKKETSIKSHCNTTGVPFLDPIQLKDE